MMTRDKNLKALGQGDLNVLWNIGSNSDRMKRTMRDALFNGALSPNARGMIACGDEPAVVRAVRVGASEGLPLAVLSGGHDPWGRACTDGNLVIDVRPLKRIHVDQTAGQVRIEGGVLASELLSALPADKALVVGTCTSVGIVGHALSGGYGNLTSRFGLACDALKSARIVLADGRVATVNERDDADLFWALRGGGSGFGVVTEVTLALQNLARVLSTTIAVPLSGAKAALEVAQAAIDEHPVNLSVTTAFATPPGAERSVIFWVLWSGGQDRGEAVVERLAASTGGHVVAQRWSSFSESFDPENEKMWPKHRGLHLRSTLIGRFNHETIEILVDGARRMPGATDAIFIHDFHGTPAGVPVGATAFPLRRDHFLVELIATWDGDAAAGATSRTWVEHLIADMTAVTLPEGYPNLCGPEESDRVRTFYGAAAERLRDVKRRVDPHDQFRSAIGRLT